MIRRWVSGLYLALVAWQFLWHALLPSPHGSRNWILASVAANSVLSALLTIFQTGQL